MKQLNDLLDLVRAFFDEASSSECENLNSEQNTNFNDNITPIFPPLKMENKNDSSNIFTSKGNAEEIIRIIMEFDEYVVKCTNQDTVEIAKLMQFRLMEYLVSLGAILIYNDDKFCNERHIPVPLSFTQNGKPIRQFVRYGVILNNVVLLKAKVEVVK